MRILLDNCVDRNLAKSFAGHDAKTAVEMAWDRLKNGELLAEAAKQFDVLVTTDKNIRYQHNLTKLPIPVFELDTPTSRLKELATLEPWFPHALEATKRFRFVSLRIDGHLVTLAPK